MTVAKLKNVGISCEFIAEQARVYIAETRYTKKLNPQDKLLLNDSDQALIMNRQLEVDTVMSTVTGPEVIVVSDSSPLNSLLYMTDEFRSQDQIKALTARAIGATDLIFYAMPIRGIDLLDPNRIHDEAESVKIDLKIVPILKQMAPTILARIIPLTGNPDNCLDTVFGAIVRRKFS